MNVIIFDEKEIWQNFLPLTFTRPVADLRIGILTIKEKWEKYLKTSVSYKSENYLQKKYPLKQQDDNLWINSRVLPDERLAQKLLSLKKGEKIISGEITVAARVENFAEITSDLKSINYDEDIEYLTYVWELFTKNEKELAKDFVLLTKGRESAPISETNLVFNRERIFVEEGAKIEGAVLNPLNGYIYIGKDAEIMENSVIRGSFAMLEHSVLKIGAKIYGATTLGPYVKVGGEVSNVVFWGYSNKAHDGFLGNAAVGQWCNFGADTNNSNLKNNYAEVKLWNYREKRFVKTGLQFCGLIMGDHSKTGINTMFNTGTVVGVSANIFGAGYPRNFIPSFSWGGASGFTLYRLEKALETAKLVMQRRNKILDQTEIDILTYVFELTSEFRR